MPKSVARTIGTAPQGSAQWRLQLKASVALVELMQAMDAGASARTTLIKLLDHFERSTTVGEILALFEETRR